MRVWSSNPLAFNCGAALYSLQRATEAAKPFPMWESSKQPLSSLAGGGGPGGPKSPERAATEDCAAVLACAAQPKSGGESVPSRS